ncbi:hypothetical protein [Serratia marcescens]|uniref:hypothetical protein n=1 Tax=Serratia marcescens TaxID=615 RepID=UPI003EE2F548
MATYRVSGLPAEVQIAAVFQWNARLVDHLINGGKYGVADGLDHFNHHNALLCGPVGGEREQVIHQAAAGLQLI